MSVNIVLIGKTGHGKSSTGNTFLGQECFLEDASPYSTTHMIERRVLKVDDITFHIYDTPGPLETEYTNNNNGECEQLLCQNMDMLIRVCSPNGINAFFFVYNIMIKFTPEEKRVTEILEKVYGHDFLSNHGVLIFTHGDKYKGDLCNRLDKNKSPIKELINKFGDRAPLIINNTSLPQDRQKARMEMIKVAKEMYDKGNVYSIDNYKNAEKTRKLLIFQAKLPQIKERFKSKIKVLEEEICKQKPYSKEGKKLIEDQINILSLKVDEDSMGTDMLKEIKDQLNMLKIQLKNTTCSIS